MDAPRHGDEREVSGGWLPPEAEGPRPAVGGEPAASPRQPPPRPHSAPYAPVPPGTVATPAKDNALAIVGLVCSIAGVALLVLSFGFLWLLSLPLSIAGLVCGLLGRRKVDRGELQTGRGLGQAGFVVGVVGLVLHALAAVGLLLLLGAAFDTVEGLRTPKRDRPPALDRTALTALVITLRP